MSKNTKPACISLPNEMYNHIVEYAKSQRRTISQTLLMLLEPEYERKVKSIERNAK